MEISSAINRLRCEARLTQAQFAGIFGVGTVKISDRAKMTLVDIEKK